ncbi:MAG: maleylpyruvate isomerase family mycothiol-dependent enzyme [Acidimicrobiia bacterium]
MREIGDAYCATRLRVRALLEAAPPGAADLVVPACPSWTVHATVAHLAGVSTDLVEGRLDGLASDAWTAAQVERARGESLPELLDRWDEHGAVVDSMADGFGAAGGQLVADVVSHEHDLRHALGEPGARDSDAVAIGFRFMSGGVRNRRNEAGAPPLLVRHETGERLLGNGEPGAWLTTTRFEFLRASSGRRTVDEIDAMEWSGDARPDLLLFADLFTPRTTSLGE